MKLRFTISFSSWIVLLVLSVFFIWKLNADNKDREQISIKHDISKYVKHLEEESFKYFDLIDGVSFTNTTDQITRNLKNDNWYVVVSEHNRPIYWNSNKLAFDTLILRRSGFPVFYIYGDDFYVVFKKENENAFLAHRVANDGIIEHELVEYYPELENYKLSITDENASVSHLHSLTFTLDSVENSKDWIWSALMFFIALFLFFFYYRQKKWTWALISAFVVIVLDVIIYLYSETTGLANFQFYQPEVYASSNLLSSIGVLLHHVLAAIPVLFLLRIFLKERKINIWLKLVLFTLMFFATDLCVGIAESLILDSNISFNFAELYGISTMTFLAVAIIGLVFASLYLLIHAFKLGKSLKAKNHWWAIAVAAIIFTVFQILDANRSIIAMLTVVGLAISFALIDGFIQQIRFKTLGLFGLVLVLSSFIITKSQDIREYNYIHHYASKLVASQDIRAEYILRSVEDRLAEEFLKPEDYDHFSLRKDFVENRIKRLYFSNYLEKYELRLISFDSSGRNINDNNLYSFEDLDDVYNNNTKRTLSNYFYQINNPVKFNGYIAKYENCDLNGHYGTTYIILQPRIIQSEFLYPEAFANQTKQDLINLENYSFGIYFHNRLISQKGSFEYALNELPKEHGNNDNYEHFVFSDVEGFDVALSNEKNSWTNWLSCFTMCFIFLLPIGLITVLVLFVLDVRGFETLMDLKGRYLSTRIQASLTILLLVGLLLSVYIIISYIQINYHKNLDNQLLITIKNISAQFQNKVDLKQKLSIPEDRQLILNEESSTYKVDLNFYSVDGDLLSTTKPYLLTDGVIGDLMNPIAFRKMSVEKSSQLLLLEEIEGSFYHSAYVPLFDGKNDVIGYLNTPYFTKNEELNKQISSVIVNVINIYFLLLLGGIFVALVISRRISKPLILIRQKFAETELGGSNELITYNRDDEIGQLVKQYNKMVLELEESVSKLAATEREGAWREMAKQVAHEIKNPLTPMKLSIQHLQRAFNKGGEKLEPLFKRTSALLIDQIDSLSNMASEFSSFAKMPEYKMSHFSLTDALKSTAQLFELSENASIVTKIEPDVYTYGDQEQIKRVFNNLIKNAVQAIPSDRKGKVEVSLSKKGNMAFVGIKDNGTGIPDDIRKKVFVPNFSTKNSGMGLGLAICKKIIENANGQISFVSEIDKGSVFSVVLPISDEK